MNKTAIGVIVLILALVIGVFLWYWNEPQRGVSPVPVAAPPPPEPIYTPEESKKLIEQNLKLTFPAVANEQETTMGRFSAAFTESEEKLFIQRTDAPIALHEVTYADGRTGYRISYMMRGEPIPNVFARLTNTIPAGWERLFAGGATDLLMVLELRSSEYEVRMQLEPKKEDPTDIAVMVMMRTIR